MTQEEKRICAERLFDEIGLIDDRFIAEAASPYAPRERRLGLRRFFVIAVSVALAVCVGVGAFAVGKLGQKGEANAPEADNEIADKGDGLPSTLAGRLDAMREDTDTLKVEKTDAVLFSGSPTVIWKYSDENEYRVSYITHTEAEELSLMLRKNRGTRADGNETETKLEGLWISSGDGRVISPYLEQTEGNTGYGEVFEYEPEYEPSEEFSEYLCDVIS